MSKVIYGIYGASGLGKEVMPLLQQQLQTAKECYFIDDAKSQETLNGYRVLTLQEFLKIEADEYCVNIAIANSKIREMLTDKCLKQGIKIIDIKAQNIVVLDEVQMGSGAILSAFVTLTSNIKIGKSFHANIYSYVAHDCVIGDFVTFAPAVKCNGNIVIEDHVYIGTGAIIKQGTVARPLVIGQGSTIAAGAVVTKNVPAGLTVFGNPAIELTKENLKRRR